MRRARWWLVGSLVVAALVWWASGSWILGVGLAVGLLIFGYRWGRRRKRTYHTEG